jgi:hypothetical protein
MLSEYNVLDSFWAKAINTTCHALNRLYCHRLLKKLHINFSLEESQTSLIFGYLDANAIS